MALLGSGNVGCNAVHRIGCCRRVMILSLACWLGAESDLAHFMPRLRGVF